MATPASAGFTKYQKGYNGLILICEKWVFSVGAVYLVRVRYIGLNPYDEINCTCTLSLLTQDPKVTRILGSMVRVT